MAALLLFALATTAYASAVQTGGFSFTHGARVRSDIFYNSVNDASIVELIVLWRGQPWWDRQMPVDAGSGTPPAFANRNDRLDEVNGVKIFSTRGAISYSIVQDRDRRYVIINGTDTVRYGADSTAVIMVDRIDSVGGRFTVAAVRVPYPARAAVLGIDVPRDSLPAIFNDPTRRRGVNDNVTRFLNTLPVVAEFIK